MSFVPTNSSVDSNRRLGRTRSWISRITKHMSSQSTSLSVTATTPEYQSQLVDDSDSATLCTPSSFNQQYNIIHTAPVCDNNNAVLDSAQVDTAIAFIVRARQQDQLGNRLVASRLMVAGLEHLARSLQNIGAVEDAYVRERLSMLHVLLASDNTAAKINEHVDMCSTRCPEPSMRAANSLRSACIAVITGVFELITQLIIIWLVLVGNAMVWLALQFKQSNIPETSTKWMVKSGAWLFAICKAWHAHEYAIKAGKMSAAWMTAVDRETEFSQKIVCSLAAVLGAIARAVENSSWADGNCS